MKKAQVPSADEIWKKYQKGLSFNARLGLDGEVENNENFFIGKQWEGVQSNGLPTPVFNFLKRVTLFTVATVTSENVKLQALPLGGDALGDGRRVTAVINRELERIFELGEIGGLIREYARNAAVDGDGCMYTYWDPEAETGQAAKGAIVTEIVENTRVFFGNPNDRRVQKQPYIIIEKLCLPEDVKKLAERAGADPELIVPDGGERQLSFAEQASDSDRVTVLMYFYRDAKTGKVRCCECTRSVFLGDRDLGLSLYPVTWFCWDQRQDNFHGQALISGLIPNQIFINKLFAMSMISLMTTAYPKIIYDKTRISRWDNRVGAAIGVNGGDMNSVARIIDPAQISPQIAQFIQLAVEYTESFLGATSVALGDARPDNTSAILALQRAAATPHELTKRSLYASIEELGRIYLDFMAVYYGTRQVVSTVPRSVPDEVARFAGLQPGGEVQALFDFSQLSRLPMQIKLDVGASAYWSEIASMQTLDNLLMSGKIGLEEYLERIPDGYITQRQELLEKIRSTRETMERMNAALSQGGEPDGMPSGGAESGVVPGGEPGGGIPIGRG
jgi:hypothetical protein